MSFPVILRIPKVKALSIAFAIVIVTAPRVQAATTGFDIVLSVEAVFPEARPAFFRAEQIWESLIVGYRDTVSSTVLSIDAAVEPIDGTGGTLGTGSFSSVDAGLEFNFLYARSGRMRFDSADMEALLANDLLEDVVLHEMGHVIGFGTLWNETGLFQELYTRGSGQYTGASALAAYRRDFDSSAMFVPVELEGGPGTADVHWNEEDFANETMTGFISGPSYISTVTLGSFADIGYVVVPEPSSFSFLFLVFGILGSCRRTRRAKSRSNSQRRLSVLRCSAH